jgi:hypothetical protein
VRRLLKMAEGKKLRRSPPSNTDDEHPEDANMSPPQAIDGSLVKFEIFGKEMIEKRVNASGNSGRVYLPPEWVGHKVKITLID